MLENLMSQCDDKAVLENSVSQCDDKASVAAQNYFLLFLYFLPTFTVFPKDCVTQNSSENETGSKRTSPLKI